MVGKTSTAEILHNPSKHPSSLPPIYKHTWFGSIAFQEKLQWDTPELVVVVFLRFSDSGREAAPICSQMIHKWKEIQTRYQSN
jgi:cell division protein FtsI/penicillin-binding protein 2